MVITFPILLSPGRNGIDWIRVSHELIKISPFFLIFLVNNFVLFSLLRKNRNVEYFLFAGILILGFSFLGSFNYLVYDFLNIPQPHQPEIVYDTLWVMDTLFYNAIFSILVVGLNNAIKIAFSWLQNRKDFEQLQKENFKNQLSLLQHQINPHFFMNTLNNIHALIDYDQEIAKHSVVKLSQLMRVLLYENENYTLLKEIDFIKDYIELMKIRVSQNVEIAFHYPGNLPNVSFPPLLFISFVENAFKHGILAEGKSFVHIHVSIDPVFLYVEIENSYHQKKIIEHGTIGMNNSRQRLDLIYGKSYKLDVRETGSTYTVRIKIPIYEDKVSGNR